MSNLKKKQQLNEVDKYLQRKKNAETGKRKLHAQRSNASKKQRLHHEDVISNTLTKSINEDSTMGYYNNKSHNSKRKDHESILLISPIRVSNRIAVRRQLKVDNESTRNSLLMHSTPIGKNKKKNTISKRIVKSVKSKAKKAKKDSGKTKKTTKPKLKNMKNSTTNRNDKLKKTKNITKKTEKNRIKKEMSMANEYDQYKQCDFQEVLNDFKNHNSSKSDMNVTEDYKTYMERIKLLQPDIIKKHIKDNQDFYINYKMPDECSKKNAKKNEMKNAYKCYPFNSQQQLAMYLTLRDIFNIPKHQFLECRFLFTKIMPEVSRRLFAQTFQIKISAASRLIKILYPTPVCPV